MPAPVSGRWLCSTSPSTAAPPKWPCARAGGATRGWISCTPLTRAAPTRLRSAARAPAVPCWPAPERRHAFIEQLQGVLDGAQRDRHLVVYLDEVHLHQDADLGYGWAQRGQRFWVASSSPGLSARVSFYGLYLYNEGQVRLWPYPRANG